MDLIRFSESKSNKGNTLLAYQGFDYSYEAESRTEEGLEYWRCTRKMPYCPGRASVQINWQYDQDGIRYKLGRIKSGHNHPPTLGKFDIREANEKIRQEAKSEYPTTSRNIVRDVRANLSADVRVNAPSVSYMRRNFNYAKQKHREEVFRRF